jgi:hypothetical protein
VNCGIAEGKLHSVKELFQQFYKMMENWNLTMSSNAAKEDQSTKTGKI